MDLYAAGSSFGAIGKELDVSKSRVGGLIRDGIESLRENNGVVTPTVQVVAERVNEPMDTHLPSLPHNPMPESYTLETAGIPKRILLTPKALMIFNIWTSCEFEGDLSDFLEDAVIHLYETRQPASRGNFR